MDTCEGRSEGVPATRLARERCDQSKAGCAKAGRLTNCAGLERLAEDNPVWRYVNVGLAVDTVKDGSRWPRRRHRVAVGRASPSTVSTG